MSKPEQWGASSAALGIERVQRRRKRRRSRREPLPIVSLAIFLRSDCTATWSVSACSAHASLHSLRCQPLPLLGSCSPYCGLLHIQEECSVKPGCGTNLVCSINWTSRVFGGSLRKNCISSVLALFRDVFSFFRQLPGVDKLYKRATHKTRPFVR